MQIERHHEDSNEESVLFIPRDKRKCEKRRRILHPACPNEPFIQDLEWITSHHRMDHWTRTTWFLHIFLLFRHSFLYLHSSSHWQLSLKHVQDWQREEEVNSNQIWISSFGINPTHFLPFPWISPLSFPRKKQLIQTRWPTTFSSHEHSGSCLGENHSCLTLSYLHTLSFSLTSATSFLSFLLQSKGRWWKRRGKGKIFIYRWPTLDTPVHDLKECVSSQEEFRRIAKGKYWGRVQDTSTA